MTPFYKNSSSGKAGDNVRRGRAKFPIGRVIRHWRQSRGLTQRAFGKAVNLSHITVSRIESGICPHIKTLSRIAGYFGLTLHDFLFTTPFTTFTKPEQINPDELSVLRKIQSHFNSREALGMISNDDRKYFTEWVQGLAARVASDKKENAA